MIDGVPALEAGVDFELDPFQVEANAALDDGRSVLVAAPTGSGKTVVAEHAVERALAEGRKAFYTAPIKALSNQKYRDFVARYGFERVGLLTGDNAINPEAPVVVMTTEVLRNMIYARSGALDGLAYVVLDEVHYLQDPYRGPVWEEVIIHLPRSVKLVCLSATVSNADELADWIGTVRGPTATVVATKRPVELRNLYCIADRSAHDLHLLPVLDGARANREAQRLDDEAMRGDLGGRGRGRRRFSTPRRTDVVARLDDEGLLPAIFFIFSRAACDDAVTSCVAWGLRLTTPDERARIRAIAEQKVEALSDSDLDVLGYDRWLLALEQGIAAHHAGMVPPFKEAVEECFNAGLVKVVFATETLALGINMPARTVVIEKLSKFTGERHQFLTAGEFTQLTGRAGRRGLDPVGHAVVLWSPFVRFEQVVDLVTSRSFRLTSSFRPTYNMAANLVQRYEAAQARHLLNLSFAQFQADRSIVQLEARLERRTKTLEALEDEAVCDRGDVAQYRELLDARRQAQHALRAPRLDVEAGLERLRPGDLIDVRHAKGSGRSAVISYANRRHDSVLKVITANRKVVQLRPADFEAVPEVLGRIDLPTPFAPNNHTFQQNVARRVQRAKVRAASGPGRRRAGEQALDEAEAALVVHPVHRCEDREAHVRAAVQAERLRSELDAIRRSVTGRSESLARRFDRVLRIMEAWDFLDGWALTDKGRRLGRLYHESDLLIAEAVSAGLFDGLEPASVAALASVFTYEHRSSAPPPEPWFPTPTIKERFTAIEQLWLDLGADERRLDLDQTRSPDPGFIPLAHAWAAGGHLADVLEDEDLSAGDFVRNVKQLIDLLRQIADAAADGTTARRARQAADALFRDVVAASSVVGAVGGPASDASAGQAAPSEVPSVDVSAVEAPAGDEGHSEPETSADRAAGTDPAAGHGGIDASARSDLPPPR